MSNQTRVSAAISVAAAIVAFALAFLATSLGHQIWGSRALVSKAVNAAPVKEGSEHTLYCGLWRTDGLFAATIRIKNVLVIAPLEVQPVLYMADGTAYNLPPVAVPSGGVSTISINQALAQIPFSIAGHASEYGSAALTYRYSSPGHVFGSIQSLDVTHSLTFVYPFFETMKMDHPALQTVEGLWWKHDAGVSGFVDLANITDKPKQVSLQLLDSRGKAAPPRFVSVPPRASRMLRLEDLSEDFRLPQDSGGVRVEYQGPPGTLVITGGLLNETNGYSANIPFWLHDTESSAPFKITYGMAGLMVGKPDPMMMPGFPASTEFSLYLAVRNTTERPLNAAFQLNYMNGASIVTRNLPNLQLRPFEATQVDMRSILKSAGLAKFSGMVNLSVSYTGHTGDLLLASGSVDQTGTYVFEVEPQGVGPSNRKIGSYWSVADGNDTMFNLWNPTDSAQDITATFYYGDGSGKYTLPVSLMPQGSTMIDMGMLIAERMPDANKNVIPATVVQGSVSFISSDEIKRMNLIIAAGTFNVETATCGRICVNCCAIRTPVLLPPNPSVPVGHTLQGSASGLDCTGVDEPLAVGSWSSSETTVATVNSSGLMSGVAAGTATISGQLGDMTTEDGLLCANNTPPICQFGNPLLETPVTVPPVIRAVSPAKGSVGASTTVTISGSGFGTSPSVSAGSGITVSVNSAEDTQIQATFQIAATAPAGNHSVAVTASGQTSNSVNFFVQVPTSLSIVAGTDSTLPESSCSAGSFGTGCGVTRSFVYQVNDQTGQAIQTAGLQIWDAISVTSPNNLGLNGFTTTCTSVGLTNSGPCNVATNSVGQFGENKPGLSACSTVCRVNNACTTGGPTSVNQTMHVGPSSIVQQVSYFCDHVTVNGQ